MKMEVRNNHDRHIFLATIVLALTILACKSITIKGNPMPNPVPDVTSSDSCLKGIFPGKTTRIEVLTLLGNPLGMKQVGGQETMFYVSAIYGQLNSIVVQNDVVTLVSAVQAEGSIPIWSEVKAQFGEPAHTAYTNYSEGSMIFAFPERGLSFIADETMDVVFIQKCFIPMSLDNYMLAYGNFLPTEDPFNK